MITTDFSKHYIYQNYNYNNDKYYPFISLDDIGDFEVRLLSGRIVSIIIEKKIESIFNFDDPSYRFIIETDLNEFIKEFNAQFFNGEYYETLVFLTCNLQKQYIDNLSENASFGLENDFKTIEHQRNKFIYGLSKFVKRYKLNDSSSPQITNLKLSFSDKENISIDNFLIIDDILSTYLKKYEFDYTNSTKWKDEMNKYLVGFNVESFKRNTQVNFAVSFYLFLQKKAIVDPDNSSIISLGLRIINIIFSLASVPINKDTIFYDSSTIDLKPFYSIQQVDLLNKWIKRYS